MLKAIAFRIIVRPDPVETKTKSGIVLQVNEDQYAGATTIGEIVEIGEDAWKAFNPRSAHAGLEVGDRVYYAKYAGKWVTDEDTNKRLLVINDEDVVCKSIKKESI
jgi:co-chaperonin GroES (HSP10)